MIKNIRVYHRYLGFFLSVYAISGVTMVFRNTQFLKIEKHIEQHIEQRVAPNLTEVELGRSLKIRNLKATEHRENTIVFSKGSYDKNTGQVSYVVHELPLVLKNLKKCIKLRLTGLCII